MKLTSKNRNTKSLFLKTNIALALLGCLSEGHSMMRAPGTGFPNSGSDSDEFVLNYGAEKPEKVVDSAIEEMFNVIQASSAKQEITVPIFNQEQNNVGIEVRKKNHLITFTENKLEIASAQCDLGCKFHTGKGMEQDFTKARRCYELAAKEGNAFALNNLGVMYMQGQGVKQDYGMALKYYELAAQQGNANALSQLGVMYYNGHGVEQDRKKALEYISLSAQQGDATALRSLGEMYYLGHGVEQDRKKALEYISLSAQQGDETALRNLGEIYYQGQGVKQDYGMALKYYDLAAQKGNAISQCNLGVMYAEGIGVKQDYRMALKYFGLAAQKGTALAQSRLGDMYYQGQGVKQDYGKALEYFKLSAQQGHADALYGLGILYSYALGVEKNYELALKYHRQAANQGHSQAKLNVTQLEKIIESSKETSFDNKNASPIPLSQQDKIKPAENRGLTKKSSTKNRKNDGKKVLNSKPSQFSEGIESAIEAAIPEAKLGMGGIETNMENSHENPSPILLSQPDTINSIESEVPNKNEDSGTKPKKGVRKILDLKSSSLLHKRFSKDKEHKKKKSSPSLVSEGTESIIEPLMSESEQTYLSEMSERSESTKSKRLKIVKPSKLLWNDTTSKSGKEKKAEKKDKVLSRRKSMIILQLPSEIGSFSQRDISERSSVSKSERSEVDKSKTEVDFKKLVEVNLAAGHFHELADCLGCDTRVLKKVILTEDVIFKTLEKLKKLGVIKYSGKSSSIKRNKIHATFRSGDANPPCFTAHIHNHNSPWHEQKNVRDDFLGFIAACGLDPIKLIQLNQQINPMMIIPVDTDKEADGARSEGEED